MKNLQQYFSAIDNKLKGLMLEIASSKDVHLNFTGFYIETNQRTGILPSPIYATYKEYRKECPYGILTHVRYFFELTKGELQHEATVHLSKRDFHKIHFSIEELGGEVEVKNPENLNLSDLSLLISFVKKKFE